jgi:hypothetical protein
MYFLCTYICSIYALPIGKKGEFQEKEKFSPPGVFINIGVFILHLFYTPGWIQSYRILPPPLSRYTGFFYRVYLHHPSFPGGNRGLHKE